MREIFWLIAFILVALIAKAQGYRFSSSDNNIWVNIPVNEQVTGMHGLANPLPLIFSPKENSK